MHNEQKTTNGIEKNKIVINKTKQVKKTEKQQKQKEQQEARDLKKKGKMQRAVAKFKALNKVAIPKLTAKRKNIQDIRKSARITVRERKGSLRSAVSPLGGGGMIQKGGGVIDTLIGNKLEELYTDVNIIAFMNQIYSNNMPYELLLILLIEFDFEYSGISNESGEMIPLSQLPTDLEEISPNLYPMVLSRGEYLLKFQRELSNLINNSNIGLSEENKIILEKFTSVEVIDIIDSTTDYNTDALENVLTDDNFNILSSLEEMKSKVLVEKNVPCFLLKINSNTELINNYLNSMSFAWLTILKNVSESKSTDDKDLNKFQEAVFDLTESGVLPSSIPRSTAAGLAIPSPDVKASLQNIHLITTLLTFKEHDDTCELYNPLVVDEEERMISKYIRELNTVLKLKELCKDGVSSDNNLKEIKELMTKLRSYDHISIHTIIIYLLTIIGAILFDVTELYFPNFINEENQKNLLTIIRGQDSRSVLVTNEDIMKNLNLVIENILSNIPTETCEEFQAKQAASQSSAGEE